LSEVFSSLDPKHKLFRNLAERKPIWWQNLVDNPDIYIDVRKDNYIDVYYNGGRVLELRFADKFKGKIHFEYIPLKSQKDYVPVDTHGQSPWYFITQASLALNPGALGTQRISVSSPFPPQLWRQRILATRPRSPSSTACAASQTFSLTHCSSASSVAQPHHLPHTWAG